MARVKGGNVSKNRRRKVLKEAKGYFGSKHRLYKTAQEQVFHSGAYAYRDRRQNKRNFRKLWITRINAACRENEISYSKFINGLAKAGIEINRKMLSEMAIDDPKSFTSLVETAKKLVKPGMNGPFCLQCLVNDDREIVIFEMSARIDGGTNSFMNGSAYSYIQFGEVMSMGRRISREIKNAIETDKLDVILT